MKKSTLNKNVAELKNETRIALQTVYDALNQGQRKKVVKEQDIKVLFDRYGVVYE